MDLARLLERFRLPLTVILGLIVVAGCAYSLLPPAGSPLVIESPTATAREIKVYVTGPVHNPGVHSLAADARVEDAVEAAGGVTADADLERLNLAARVHDGMHIQVPYAQTATGQGAAGASAGSELININTASAELLDTLPGVGPATVSRIIEHRQTIGPFQRIEELLELKYVNSSTFEKIRSRITAP